MRKDKRPVLFTDRAVMFEMENGWFYLVCVDGTVDNVAVYGHPVFYTRFNPYCQGAKSEKNVPADLLAKAKELLQTLPVKPGIGAFAKYEPFDEHENPYPERFKKK